ncbi:MAG: NAD(P)H-binding protein [Fimbriimonadaceae bacterium]|nr:NAD(P)H-binding protein [Chitinophagales bacterium]
MNKKAVVFGATGLIGEYLVQELIKNPEYSSVVLFVRKETSFTNSKTTQIIVDFENLPAHKNEFADADVYCCLGTTIANVNHDKEAFKKVDLYYPLQIAQLAKENSANQFIVISSMGADANSKFFYNRVKGELEAKLKTLQLNSLQILHPSLLLGSRKEFRFGERISQIISPLFTPLLTGQYKKYRPIYANDVAKAMIKIALQNKKGINIHSSEDLRLIAN